MTRRERMERRAERRREWADGRRSKAGALLAQNEPFRGDWAFATQPGHIPERTRANRRDARAFEHETMARHHVAKAAGIEAQLARSVFSDDPDAVEALEARIAEREAEAARITAYNATCRAAAKRGETHGDLSLLSEAQKRDLLGLARVGQLRAGGAFPAYATTNMRARIATDRRRLEEIRRRETSPCRCGHAKHPAQCPAPDGCWCDTFRS